METAELNAIDVILDENKNGVVDGKETSVLFAPVDLTGTDTEIVLEFDDHVVAANSTHQYLVVADLEHTVRSGDEVQLDVVDVKVDVDLNEGIAPVVRADRVRGESHVLSGRIELERVVLEQVQVGGSGRATISLTSASDLAAGEKIVLVFPQGFDLSRARVDAATQTPSGFDPTGNAQGGTERSLVLTLAADEAAGEYSLVVAGVGNPAIAQKDLQLNIQSRQIDDTQVDGGDLSPAGFAVIGILQLRQGKELENALVDRAGVGGAAIPLIAFELAASGEDIALGSVQVRPSLSGPTVAELNDIAVVLDGDGQVDSGEVVVASNAVSDGETFTLSFADHILPAGSANQYLVVADLAATIRSGDEVQFDVLGALSGAGQTTGLEPVLQGDRVAGPVHVASGRIDIKGVSFESLGSGRVIKAEIVFATASDLMAGDEIVMDFPPDFDLRAAVVLSASSTPSGVDPVLDTVQSKARRLVLKVEAVEAGGNYNIWLAGIKNLFGVQDDLVMDLFTRHGDGVIVDGNDPTPASFSVMAALFDGCREADFDGNQRVDFPDFFVFVDAFGAIGESAYDLDGDQQVNFTDFFVFVDFFGQVCGEDPFALEREIEVDITGSQTAMVFVLIEPGSFTMGSSEAEEGRNADEGPQHQVSISRGFYLGKYEVTQGQWEAVMGSRPWDGRLAVEENPQHPAVYITWNEAQEFIERLNQHAGGLSYRLPSEAEWEYAARAGTTTSWSFGEDADQLPIYAWYREDPRIIDGLTTHAAGTKQANPWGLFDVHGNAAEWVQDFYAPYAAQDQVDPRGPAVGSALVIRGGGGQLSRSEVRSASRGFFAPTVRLNTFGLRILRAIR